MSTERTHPTLAIKASVISLLLPLALIAIPGLASAGISLVIFMAGALFFPSRRVRSLSRRKMRGTLMKNNPETIVTDYYCK